MGKWQIDANNSSVGSVGGAVGGWGIVGLLGR